MSRERWSRTATVCQSVFLAFTGKAPPIKDLVPPGLFDQPPGRVLTDEEQQAADDFSGLAFQQAFVAAYGG